MRLGSRQLPTLLTTWVVVVLAGCGNDGDVIERSQGGRTGSGGTSAGQAGSGATTGCENVGCAPPPLCADGCVEACGCCSCADGEIIERTGTSYVCAGGCYDALTGSSVEWQRLQVDEGWGPCAGEICAIQWIARPDGSIEVTREGMTTSATMPAADREALDLIVADEAFQAGMMSGFECGIPPSDVAYNMTLELESGELVRDVTGCVLTGPAGNAAERAVDLLSKY